MNIAILIGNLGKDPELSTVNESKKCTFSLATSKTFKKKSGEKETVTTWHNIVFWGDKGENVSKFCKKGHKLMVKGEIVNRSYDDKDGNKKYISEIIGEDFELLERKDGQPSSSESIEAPAPASVNNTMPEMPGAIPVQNDDLPF